MINKVVENLLIDQIARRIRHTQLTPIGVYGPCAFAHARRQLVSIAHNWLNVSVTPVALFQIQCLCIPYQIDNIHAFNIVGL